MPATPTHIIETSDNRLFAVRDNGANYLGREVNQLGTFYAPKPGAYERLVRKAGSRVVASLNVGG